VRSRRWWHLLRGLFLEAAAAVCDCDIGRLAWGLLWLPLPLLLQHWRGRQCRALLPHD
jgi:hypothetical protein